MAWRFHSKVLLIIFLTLSAFSKEVEKPYTKLRIAKKTLEVEVATTIETQKKGLMHRKKLDKNKGMLFVYPQETKLTFWMKDTFIPLSIGFFNSKRELIKILEMSPQKSIMEKLPRYSCEGAKYALEVNQGWFKENGVKLGDTFSY